MTLTLTTVHITPVQTQSALESEMIHRALDCALFMNYMPAKAERGRRQCEKKDQKSEQKLKTERSGEPDDDDVVDENEMSSWSANQRPRTNRFKAPPQREQKSSAEQLLSREPNDSSERLIFFCRMQTPTHSVIIFTLF